MASRRGRGRQPKLGEVNYRRKIERIFPDPRQGLTTQQANELLAGGYGNDSGRSNAKTPERSSRRTP